MSDLSVALELVLIVCAPLVPVAVGVMLRRHFTPAPAAEGAEPLPPTGAQKAGRLIGSILIWCGVLAALAMLLLALHYKGKFL